MSQIHITIKDMKGNEKILSIYDNETIKKGKEKVGHEANIVWKYDGSVLNNLKTFRYYEIYDGETIIATPSARGGGGTFGINQ